MTDTGETDTSSASNEEQLTRSHSVTSFASDVPKPKKQTMSVHEILSFCMPAGLQHCPTTNRLYLLSEHGPLSDLHSYLSCLCTTCQGHVSKQRKTDELCKDFFKGEIMPGYELVEKWQNFLCSKCKTHLLKTLHIRSGFHSKFIVNELQVGELARQVERDDILNAYHRNNDGTSLAEQTQFLSIIKREKNVKAACRNLSKEEIVDIFHQLVQGDLNNAMEYYTAREVIAKHRAARVKRLGLMFGEKKSNPRQASRPKPVPYAAREGEVPKGVALSREGMESFGRMEDMRLAHGHLGEIAQLSDQTKPGLIANTRLLRNLNRETTTWKTNF